MSGTQGRQIAQRILLAGELTGAAAKRQLFPQKLLGPSVISPVLGKDGEVSQRIGKAVIGTDPPALLLLSGKGRLGLGKPVLFQIHQPQSPLGIDDAGNIATVGADNALTFEKLPGPVKIPLLKGDAAQIAQRHLLAVPLVQRERQAIYALEALPGGGQVALCQPDQPQIAQRALLLMGVMQPGGELVLFLIAALGLPQLSLPLEEIAQKPQRQTALLLLFRGTFPWEILAAALAVKIIWQIIAASQATKRLDIKPVAHWLAPLLEIYFIIANTFLKIIPLSKK